ncbi:MAG: chemotaxis protein CheW [Gemmatimonadota bacterium]
MKSAEHSTSVLDARARALAKPRATLDDAYSADRLELLLFGVSDERLAIPLAAIVAITRVTSVTPLPRAVPPVFGVTAWRGRPITVLSLAAIPAAATDKRRLIVLGDGRRAVLGVLADEVEDTRNITRSGLSPAPGDARYARTLGMTDDAVLVLDADALMNATRNEP